MITPRATYRLQLHAGFTFDDAAGVVDYLDDLGVSHVYLSPVAQAARGSAHGYDGVDPTRIDDERGGEAGFERLCDACRTRGLGVVIDIVPNHLDVSSDDNRWWRDVLRGGRASEFAGAFDIDWNDEEAGERVVLPVLGEPPDEAMTGGRLTITTQPDGPALRYFERSFPLRADDQHPESPGEALPRQHYDLEEWRTGSARLNYRRFFDITSLAGVRVEDDAVFDRTHALVRRLVDSGVIDGLRVDHVDGMRDPEAYLARLREAAPDRWIVVEKILQRGEGLRVEWPVDGTTGYEFADLAIGVLIDPRGEAAVRTTHERLVGGAPPVDDAVFEAKAMAATDLLGAELRRLAREFRAAMRSREPEDNVRGAIATLAACFPVYRTYVVPERRVATALDAERVLAATEEASRREPGSAPLFEAMRDLLLLRGDPVDADAAREFAARFQQYSAPVMAKGVEDTAFYRLSAFVATNDVGGEPGGFARSLDEFHAANIDRAARWPASMVTTSTHDTKRSEDVRSRLAVISERPGDWTRLAERWMAWFDRHAPGIERPLAYTLLQNIVGAWPIGPDRARAFARKAAREAKTATSWLSPDERYEGALDDAVASVLADGPVRAEVERFLAVARRAGRLNSLSLAAIKLLAPGVPDIYQGCDLWDLSLVDPDNRRAVDFAARREALRREISMPVEDVAATIAEPNDPGVGKMFITRLALRVRAERPACFGRTSGYKALRAAGAEARRVVAFVRTDTHGEPGVVLVAPRFNAGGEWSATSIDLPEAPGGGPWINRAGGGLHAPGAAPLRDLTSTFPVAVLTPEEA